MRKSGQITVFLSLVMLCVCSLVCGLVESARTAGAGWYLKVAADSAMDSVFSGYHRAAWEQYRLFLLEYGEEDEPGSTWLKHMEPYMETHGWYPAVIQSASVKGISRITDEHGANLKQEIQNYMRYGIWDTVSMCRPGLLTWNSSAVWTGAGPGQEKGRLWKPMPVS